MHSSLMVFVVYLGVVLLSIGEVVLWICMLLCAHVHLFRDFCVFCFTLCFVCFCN